MAWVQFDTQDPIGNGEHTVIKYLSTGNTIGHSSFRVHPEVHELQVQQRTTNVR